MTVNQTNALVKNPHTKKAIAVLQKFAETEATYKAAEKEAKEAAALITQAMVDAGVPKIEIDLPGLSGYITLVEKKLYKAEDLSAVPDEFLKQALDTTKVQAEVTLKGSLPEGVHESVSRYITKKFKVEK